jgi:phosphate transport system protein
MERHFDQELVELKQELLRMSACAENNLAQSLKALVTRDTDLASKVMESDSVLDQLQVAIDLRCVSLLALRQPTARDLRFIVMATKLTTDLERIGDQAVNISRRTLNLCKEPELRQLVNIPRMADMVCGMIRDALEAFVYENSQKARGVIERDPEVDELEQTVYENLTETMVADPTTISRGMDLIGVSHSLARVGDHATNIAEEIVYLYEGCDIRHNQST